MPQRQSMSDRDLLPYPGCRWDVPYLTVADFFGIASVPRHGRSSQRCQRTSVSGRMIVTALRSDGNQRHSWMKNKRSPFVNWIRPCALRCSTISGCLSAAFSASSRLFDLNSETNSLKRKQSSATIAVDVKRFYHQSNTDEVSVHTGITADGERLCPAGNRRTHWQILAAAR